MRSARAVNAEPIPGYRLLSPLGSGGFGEVWKCEAPGGLFKAIKFVYGKAGDLDAAGVPAEEELRAIQRIKAIRHPFILSLDRVEVIDGDLVIVMELADHSLHDLLVAYRESGLPGIPRGELLGYLREAAEALDVMNGQYDLQHLDVKPRNLFLVSNHVKVADFGLVNSLAGRAGSDQPPGAITPLYAAPEACAGSLSRHCDQYSLAIVYQELLTATLPFTGQNARQLMLAHAQAQPDLGPLPEPDRPLAARALAKDPGQRFASCTDFVRALLEADHGAGVPAAGDARPAGQPPPGLRDTPTGAGVSSDTPTPLPRPADRGYHYADPNAVTDVLPAPAGARATVTPPLALPGYRFLGRLRSDPVSEVWRVHGPEARKRLLKLLYGFAGRGADSEKEAIARLMALYHPGLAPLEIVHHDPGRLAVVTDLAEMTLWDHFQACQCRGGAGIPRAELLGHLRAVAEVLDYYHQQHGLQHLLLNPRTLLLERDEVLLADFGLAALLWAPAGQPVCELNLRYSAPELFNHEISPACDQYSLALTYQELLTGEHPFRGRARGQGRPPDLGPLPETDRDIIARALQRDPARRWETCTEFVRRLAGADAGAPGGGPSVPTLSVRQLITELLAAAAVHSCLQQPEAAAAGQDAEVLRQRYRTRLPRPAVRPRLDQLRQQWNGHPVSDADDVVTFQVVRSLSFWQRCTGRAAGLEVCLHLPPGEADGPTEVLLFVRPFGCGKGQAAQLLQAVGPLLVESAGTCLEAPAERRVQERLPWPHPLRARFVLPGRRLGEAVVCGGKDISLTGIGFHALAELPSRQAYLELTTSFHEAAISVPVRIVRVRHLDDGSQEVGAAFS
jgi:serine/threonine protein kinase